MNKAFTAACHRRPTHTYTNAQSGGEAFGIMNMHGGRFAIFVGGWPIEVDGEVVGGIGVSGGHTKEDIACCKAGVTAILEHLGQAVEIERRHCFAQPRASPECERAPQRQLAVERQSLVGQRLRVAFDPSRARREQPRDHPDQARLAAPVGPGDMSRLARAQLQVELLEQQPPPAHQRRTLDSEQIHACASSACMSSSLNPK